MSRPIQALLPQLMALARQTTCYPVTLRPDDDDGEPIYVFEVRDLPWGDVLQQECERVSGALSDYCYDRDLPQDFAVVPVNPSGVPPPPWHGPPKAI